MIIFEKGAGDGRQIAVKLPKGSENIAETVHDTMVSCFPGVRVLTTVGVTPACDILSAEGVARADVEIVLTSLGLQSLPSTPRVELPPALGFPPPAATASETDPPAASSAKAAACLPNADPPSDPPAATASETDPPTATATAAACLSHSELLAFAAELGDDFLRAVIVANAEHDAW